jgi:hypothetical protein
MAAEVDSATSRDAVIALLKQYDCLEQVPKNVSESQITDVEGRNASEPVGKDA